MLGENEDPDSFYYNYEKRTHTVEVDGKQKKVKEFPVWGSRKNEQGKSFNIAKPEVRKPTKGFGG
jgi:hypothetical protein